jgi:uncharacterized protein YbjT (DUF2867 family)
MSSHLDSRTLNSESRHLRILVAGGSGFIGRKLISRLSISTSSQSEILCLTRRPDSFSRYFGDNVKVVKGDVSDPDDMRRVLRGIDIAYYLVHSMEGDAKHWKKFAERDRAAAANFAKAATERGVRRIIYLGGLSHGKYEELSEHMKSRREVGDILRTSSAKVTIFNAAVILGQGGGSFQMLRYLVERLPLMVCPRWVLTKSQPISVDDVVTYLAAAIQMSETEGRTFEIGGPEALTYVDMMTRYAAMINKKVRVLIIPFLTPRLSSYWVDLVTPVPASLARPLIDSLKHEAVVKDDSVRQIISFSPKRFEQAIRDASLETPPKGAGRQERTSISLNIKILVASLLALAVFGFIYYAVDWMEDPYHPVNLTLLSLWYLGIAFALYFIRQGARLGGLAAGIVGWMTLAFWLFNGSDIFMSGAMPAAPAALLLDAAGIITVCLEIGTSHNVFHKLRPRSRD